MYIPPRYRVTDTDKLHSFMAQNSFATLVTDITEIAASHLPLLVDKNIGQLIGHMANANDQWQGIDGEPCLAIFSGSHAYISATWYEGQNVVPTWNYVAVHAYGRIYLETDKSRVLEIVRQTTDYYESTMPSPWTMDHAETEFIDKIADMIVGFRIEIDRLEGNWKLNQHHSAERKAKTVAALRANGTENHLDIAQLMEDS